MKCYSFYVSNDGTLYDNYQDCKDHEERQFKSPEDIETKRFQLKSIASHIQTALCADFTMDDCKFCPVHDCGYCVNFSPYNEGEVLNYLDKLAQFVCKRKGVDDWKNLT